MAGGLLVWGVPTMHYIYPTWAPLRAPLPVATGSSLHQDFSVRTGEPYHLILACQSTGPLQDAWREFTSSGPSQPRLPCDIDIRVLRQGRPLHSEHLSELRPAGLVGGSLILHWHLAFIHLPASGHYELELTNRSDLSHLQITQPTIEMSVGSAFHKNRGIIASLARIAGGFIFAIGLVCFLVGVWPRGTRPLAKHGPLHSSGSNSVRF